MSVPWLPCRSWRGRNVPSGAGLRSSSRRLCFTILVASASNIRTISISLGRIRLAHSRGRSRAVTLALRSGRSRSATSVSAKKPYCSDLLTALCFVINCLANSFVGVSRFHSPSLCLSLCLSLSLYTYLPFPVSTFPMCCLRAAPAVSLLALARVARGLRACVYE